MVNQPKKSFSRLMSAVLLAVLVLTACSTAATQSPTESTLVPATTPAQGAATTTILPADASASPTAEAVAQAGGAVSFSRDILPIFNETCIKCHGGDKTEKGLDMKSYSALLAGSERGAVVVPGDANGSRLAQLVVNGKMPKRGPKLSSEQVQLILDWINSGAQNN